MRSGPQPACGSTRGEGRRLGCDKGNLERSDSGAKNSGERTLLTSPLMTALIFVAPYGLAPTMRFLTAAASLPDVTFGLVSHEPEGAFMEKLAPEDRSRVVAYAQVGDALDPDLLKAGAPTRAERDRGIPTKGLAA